MAAAHHRGRDGLPGRARNARAKGDLFTVPFPENFLQRLQLDLSITRTSSSWVRSRHSTPRSGSSSSSSRKRESISGAGTEGGEQPWERSRGCKTKGFALFRTQPGKSPGLYLPNAGYRHRAYRTRLLYQFISLEPEYLRSSLHFFPLSTGNREQFLWMQRSLLHLEKRQPVRPLS